MFILIPSQLLHNQVLGHKYFTIYLNIKNISQMTNIDILLILFRIISIKNIKFELFFLLIMEIE